MEARNGIAPAPAAAPEPAAVLPMAERVRELTVRYGVIAITVLLLVFFLASEETFRRSTTLLSVLKYASVIAIGGLQQEVSREIRRRIPLLSDIPVLGALFRSHHLDKTQRELAIFVVPHLLDDQGHFQGALLLQGLNPEGATSPPSPGAPPAQ